MFKQPTGSTRLLAFASGLVPTLAVGAALTLQSSPALAADPVSCMNVANPSHPSEDDYGQVTGQENDGSTSDDLRGIRADLFINLEAECQRIQGVHVLAPAWNGEFEFAYIRGWWGPSSCSGVDHDHFYTQPTLFNVRIDTNGSYSCTFWPAKHPVADQWDSFRVSDRDANTYWGSYWKGVALQPDGINMSYSRGHGVINMERGGENDAGKALFKNIEEYHDGNDWTVTNNLTIWYDHDFQYDLQTPDEHTANIVR